MGKRLIRTQICNFLLEVCCLRLFFLWYQCLLFCVEIHFVEYLFGNWNYGAFWHWVALFKGILRSLPVSVFFASEANPDNNGNSLHYHNCDQSQAESLSSDNLVSDRVKFLKVAARIYALVLVHARLQVFCPVDFGIV